MQQTASYKERWRVISRITRPEEDECAVVGRESNYLGIPVSEELAVIEPLVASLTFSDVQDALKGS